MTSPSGEPTPFTLNRPIHLARRDVHFEHASNCINTPIQKLNTQDRIQHIEQILYHLHRAEEHAFLAARSPATPPREHDFSRFLRLLQNNVASIRTMLSHHQELDGAESFLCQFLNVNQHEQLLPAMQYQRRSEDLLEGLWQLLQLAHMPYRRLKQTTLDSLPEDDRKRYLLAFDCFIHDLQNTPSASP